MARRRASAASSRSSGSSGRSPRATSSRGRRNVSRNVSKSERSNLIMPVPRVKAMLKVNNYAGRVSDKAAVFLTAALEYAATEVLELSLNQARMRDRTRIHSKHVNLAVSKDPELRPLFKNAVLAGGGTVPYHQQEVADVQARQPLQAAQAEMAVPEQQPPVPPAKRRRLAKKRTTIGFRRRG